jgi:hypothetical protein
LARFGGRRREIRIGGRPTPSRAPQTGHMWLFFKLFQHMRINQIWNKAYELNKFESQITQIIQVSNTMATKLESSFQVPQMLDQIILQLLIMLCRMIQAVMTSHI